MVFAVIAYLLSSCNYTQSSPAYSPTENTPTNSALYPTTKPTYISTAIPIASEQEITDYETPTPVETLPIPTPIMLPTESESDSMLLPPLTDRLAFIQEMQLQYSQPVAEIPYILKRNPPSYMPFYPEIQQVRDLRNQLKTASKEEKWIFVAQIFGYLGVETLEEITGESGNEVWIPKWHNYDQNGSRILTCNTYAANAIRALGMEQFMSHWFDAEGNPNDNMEGTEYQARDVYSWLNGPKGQEYGWFEVSRITVDERLLLLKDGYIIYGANPIHNWLVFGVPYGEGKIIPVLSQSIPNTLFGEPLRSQFLDPVEGTLFAHKLPSIDQ